MKIVRIIARLNIGGPARNAVLLTDALCSRVKSEGLRVNSDWETVLVCGEVEGSEGDMMYLAREKGIKPIIIKELGRELSWKDDWTAFWKIYKIIQKEKPDIIHTHTAKAGTLGRLAGMLYRLFRFARNDMKPILIHTFHGHVFSGYFGKVKTLFFIWVEKILALFTDKIITVSENLKRELVEKFKVASENKISVIELGFELDELLKLPIVGEGLKPSPTINIGIIGRLVPIKNHRMLLKILSTLHPPPSTQKLKLIITGDGEMRGELWKYAGELGIESFIEFKGWIKDLKAIYEGLDIVVLTSLNEGTPVSLIEAMASGRPVVATRVGGVADIVQDGKNGYLVESGDEEGFNQKLMDLIKDSEKRRKFGEYGRNIVKNRFSKERLIKDTKELYNNTLQKNKNI
ncbi:MAG: glycosyltransferase family 4 protein [Candidatus Omnitrophota bacterium]|nr:glycosyltransferase family 4 protein [Candidatus Omnitrophota bacterium]